MVLFGVPELVRGYKETPLDDRGRVLYPFALRVAEDLKVRLAPACERIEIAGSLRRKRETVKDIELVCIPRIETIRNLLGDLVANRNFLGELCDYLLKCDYLKPLRGEVGESTLVSGGMLEKRPDANGRFTYGEKNKYLVHKPTGVALDIFVANKANWGLTFLIRTGSAAFVKRVMSQFLSLRKHGSVYDGVTLSDGQVISCPDEQTVFDQLGWPFIPPEERER